MQSVVFGLIGGLGLFLFGMKNLSDSLQKVAGAKLKRLMTTLTNNRIKGVMLGTAVTSIVQSSSVTTILLIGLINAGIINLTQSVGVIFGANIGTTITAQIIAFKVTKYALPGIGIGFAILMIAKKRKTQAWGNVILALGLIFLGLATMKGVVKPLRDNITAVNFLITLGKNPFLGIIVGTIMTVIIQSSSASIGMILAVASVGLIDFTAALYLMLGSNIGTTITAWLASVSGHKSAKRLAIVHTLFNVIGAVLFCFLVYWKIFPKFVDWLTPGLITIDTIARHIANAHTCFNLINTLMFLPFAGVLVFIANKFIPGEDIFLTGEMQYLQDSLISTPEIAIESSYKEIAYMAELSQKGFKNAMEGLLNNSKKSILQVANIEDAVDNLQTEITFYLSKLATQPLTPEQSRQIPRMLHSINDIERISDHAVNITDITERKINEDVKLSDEAVEEIKSLFTLIEEMFGYAIKAIDSENKEDAKMVLNIENRINKDYRHFIDNHLDRFSSKKCNTLSSFIFVDILNNLEKIADHLTNVAQSSLGQLVTVEQVVHNEPNYV